MLQRPKVSRLAASILAAGIFAAGILATGILAAEIGGGVAVAGQATDARSFPAVDPIQVKTIPIVRPQGALGPSIARMPSATALVPTPRVDLPTTKVKTFRVNRDGAAIDPAGPAPTKAR